MPQAGRSQSGRKKLAAGIYLLFAPGCRPDRAGVLTALEELPLVSVSHDPGESVSDAPKAEHVSSPHGARWLELMLSGMTFDLLGFAPGPSIETPEIVHRLDGHFDPYGVEALAIVPGPHLADGANSLPIVRSMLELACGIARRVKGVKTICWSPARSAVAMPIFCQSVEDWLSGGSFPALGMTSFAFDDSGALTSEGLAYFMGQELSISAELAGDRMAATLLGAGLVHDLVASGRVEQSRNFKTESGLDVILSPVQDARIIEVTRSSSQVSGV